MRKPNCSERDVALAALADADRGVVLLSPAERDCLARVALAALMDECLSNAEFSAIEAALQRAEAQRASTPLPAVAPARRRLFAELPAAALRAGRRAHAAMHQAHATVASSVPRFRLGRRGLASIVVCAAAVVGPTYLMTANAPTLQPAVSRETATGSACLPGAQSKVAHTELVALQQPNAVGIVGACPNPGAAPPSSPSSHHS